MLDLKREKLELQQRHLALAEAQLHQPTISIPIILPQDSGSVVLGILSTKSLRRQNRFIFMLNTSISDTLTGFSVYYLGLFDVQEGYPSRNGISFRGTHRAPRRSTRRNP
ncbi:hypothetical protein GJAV_G00035790 [Gymnothorax javanicus]|nr:hypothetical protein GJAV_G00035790 [Gymnothorax javanicus]